MRRRCLIARIRAICAVSERRACTTLDLPRSSVRYRCHRQPDEDALRATVIGVVTDYGYYGYRLVSGKLRENGWRVNHKRVARIWCEEGLKVPKMAAETPPSLAAGRLLRPSARRACQPCVELRLRGGPSLERTENPDADPH